MSVGYKRSTSTQIVSGVLDQATGIITFTKGDSSTFAVNVDDLKDLKLEDLPGYSLPDSSAIRIYNDDPANLLAYGRLYDQVDALAVSPTGWRIATESELQAITPEAGFALTGKWDSSIPGYANKDNWLNAWVADDSNPNLLEAYYGQVNGSGQGVWAGAAADCYSVFMVRTDDDGRAINATANETISGDSYTTKKLSDGLIWTMSPFRGLKLNPKQKLVLSADQTPSFEEDIPEDHTHNKPDVIHLRDDSYIEDVSGFTIPVENRYIDVRDSDTGAFKSRHYTMASMRAILPAGFRIPTSTDWINLCTQAGHTPTLNTIFQMPVAAMAELKPGGSLGINLTMSGFFSHSNHPVVPNAPHLNRTYNQSLKESLLNISSDVQCYYMFEHLNVFDNFFKLGDTTLYDQFISTISSDYLKDDLSGAVRLIKEDGVLGDGTVDINGTTYNLVDVNGVIWLAEDFRENPNSVPIHVLTKNGSDVTWEESIPTSISIAANILTLTDENGATTDIDLSLYLDDTNLARLSSATLDGGTGIATFTRDDESTFTLDLSNLTPSPNLDTKMDEGGANEVSAAELRDHLDNHPAGAVVGLTEVVHASGGGFDDQTYDQTLDTIELTTRVGVVSISWVGNVAIEGASDATYELNFYQGSTSGNCSTWKGRLRFNYQDTGVVGAPQGGVAFHQIHTASASFVRVSIRRITGSQNSIVLMNAQVSVLQ